MATSTEPKTKALVVATRCTSVEQFVATFHRFCDDSTFFVSTLAERPVGLETAFSIQLEDKTPVLRGLCTVVEAWATPVNRFGRPGVRLAVKRLTNESIVVFKMLQTARLAADAAADATPIAVARTATGTAASPPIALARAATAEAAAPIAVARTATAEAAANAPIEAGGTAAGSPSVTSPAIARTATGAPRTPPAGTPLARLAMATPPPIPRIDPKALDASAMPRLDPRVSEAPSLPRYDDTGPIVSPPLSVPPVPPVSPIAVGRAPSVNAIAPSAVPLPVAPPAAPIVGPTPVTAFARPAPKPTPSIIVEDALAVPAAPAKVESGPTKIEPVAAKVVAARPSTSAGTPPVIPPAKVEAPLVVAERVRSVGPRVLTPSKESAPISQVDEQRYVPEPIAGSDDMTNPVAVESRTPGSSFILPANPLMNLTDQSLEGFVDCALYEETGNFFRAPGYEDSLVDIDDVTAPPPMTLAPVHAIRHGAPTAPPQLSPFAFQPPLEQQFSPEQTPLPMLAPQFPPQPQRYSEPLIPTGQHYSAQEAMQYEAQHHGTPSRSTPMPRPTPMPGGQIDTSAPIDSTASLLALSAPDPRRRWMVIGGRCRADRRRAARDRPRRAGRRRFREGRHGGGRGLRGREGQGRKGRGHEGRGHEGRHREGSVEGLHVRRDVRRREARAGRRSGDRPRDRRRDRRPRHGPRRR